MGKHDQPTTSQSNQLVTKLALGAGTVTGALAFPLVATADSYTIQAGDTLSEIAQTFNTSVETLATLNHIINPEYMTTGQTIETPTTLDKIEKKSEVIVQPAETYTVQSGDTLWDIAQAHQVSIETIIEQSNITMTDYIYVGQILTIKPETTRVVQSEPIVIPAVIHIVEVGDTLWDIARTQDTTVEEIITNSKLSESDYIYAGQELIIKPAKTIRNGLITISAASLAQETGFSETRAQSIIDIANHLMGQEGFTLEGTAGALAVAERESGFDPLAVNDAGGVAGIFQWSGWSNNINGNRWANAESKTLSLDVQLALTSKELNGTFRNVKTLMTNATNPKQASLDWSLYYEGVALSDSQTKINIIQDRAQVWYDLLKDYVGDGDTISVPLDVTQGPYHTGNTYAAENCTWFVKDVFKARMGDWWGNAKDWAANAQREGFRVDQNPVENLTIAVFQPGSAGADASYGHVAVVVGVSEHNVIVKEMNGTAGLGKTNLRTIPKAAASYIHIDG